MVEHNGKTPEASSPETVHFKEPIVLEDGQVLTSAPFAGLGVLISPIPVMAPRQRMENLRMVTEMVQGTVPLQIPNGLIQVKIIVEEHETIISVPHANISYISTDKDFVVKTVL